MALSICARQTRFTLKDPAKIAMLYIKFRANDGGLTQGLLNEARIRWKSELEPENPSNVKAYRKPLRLIPSHGPSA